MSDTFAESHPAMSAPEAVAEAARCLYCHDAPCMRACPTHIDIPRFIRQILYRDDIGAAHTILQANIFGGSCARVCPTEVLCEGACVDNTILRAPIKIGLLQRHACDTAHDISHAFFAPGPATGRRVAVIGAGPAGLTCAHELRKRGHAVTVFDAAAAPGGLNTLGIAPYKMSAAFAMAEVERILRLGIELKLKTRINGPKLAKLTSEFDAVYVAIGLGRTAPVGIPGEDAAGVWESLAFVERVRLQPKRVRIGREVVVIGGGNTAIDVARTAARLGARRVTVAYRRDQQCMPAFRHEQDAAAAEGVSFEWMAIPTRIIVKNGRVAGVRFARGRMAGKGRAARLVSIAGANFGIDCDTVIKALGQEPLAAFAAALPGLRLDGKGRIIVDAPGGFTGVPRVYAGGDCVSGAQEEVVNAVQSGKESAWAIHADLTGRRAG